VPEEADGVMVRVTGPRCLGTRGPTKQAQPQDVMNVPHRCP